MTLEQSSQAAGPGTVFTKGFQRATSSPWMLLLPVIALYALVLVYPLAWLLGKSFVTETGYGLANYAQVFDTSVFASVVYRSFVIAIEVTVLCVLIGYPLAYVIHHSPPRVRVIMTAAVVSPVLVGALIRSFAWIAILENRGIINSSLVASGIIEAPIPLVYNRVGLMIGMVNVMLPFCVLPMVAGMRSIDPCLISAANSLGASPLRGFIRVFLPLSIQGVSAGALLTFLLSLGFYITPALLGGRKDSMIAQIIQVQVMNLGEFSIAAAMGWLLMVVTILLLLAYGRFFNLGTLFGSQPK
ncbi:ABC transporter permease [Limibacillus sp. MBR-115]|jgi:ABC-type spermidine/putrescine transport system permease subunit I|uniref:ABC transporter permease n=1 Tax=Limibacillus sp. MBR-115 TaxID=3156465 RepID=UPI003398FE7A